MKTRTSENIRLGIFVLAGLLLLVLALYFIGKKQNLFGANFLLKAHFSNVSGLKKGNNVRYAGIEVGTVKDIYIINDSIVEVMMVIDRSMKQFIRKSAKVSVANDGLMGNKVLNITGEAGSASPLVENGDLLDTDIGASTDELLQVLNETASDVITITKNLKLTTSRLNENNNFWRLLNDETIPANVHTSLMQVKQTTARANQFVAALQSIAEDVRSGKGSLGSLVADSTLAVELEQTVMHFKQAGARADSLARNLDELVRDVRYQVDHGNGIVNAALKDSIIVNKVNRSLDNIESATISLDQNLEALKHNFLFRGYFRRLERKKQQQGN